MMVLAVISRGMMMSAESNLITASGGPGRVTYFDYRPRPWQAEVLGRLEERRLAVIVAHRRAGKTEVMCQRLLLAAMFLNRQHPAPLFGYVAPFLKQAKAVAWDRLKFYARGLPQVRISESELSLSLWNGAVVRLFGADYPDRLRGLGFDGVVMDEVAQMRPETWPDVVRPALADRCGWAVFIGTPKGVNLFYNLYQTALRNPDDWFAGFFPADKTGAVAEDELQKLKREMGEHSFRREFLCDFTADASGRFIDFQIVEEAVQRESVLAGSAPLVFGLDVARYGDDRTVLVRRRGRVLEGLDIWQGRDLMYTASETALAIDHLKPRAVFVDSAGLGGGVVDRLRQLGYRVIGVNSGTRAHDQNSFSNLKAEMWSRMRDWLVDGALIPDHQGLKNDLLAPSYDFDAAGRLKIESKSDLKSRGLASTDIADALALTFARPVAAAELQHTRPAYATMD